jgi:hypothetical protein
VVACLTKGDLTAGKTAGAGRMAVSFTDQAAAPSEREETGVELADLIATVVAETNQILTWLFAHPVTTALLVLAEIAVAAGVFAFTRRAAQ